MKIRKTTQNDLPALLALYAGARRFMREQGNPNQWGSSRPEEATLLADIRAGVSYLCEQDGMLAAAFSFWVGEEPTYARIDGAWLDDAPYGVVHRIASARQVHGAGRFCLEWCFDRCGNLRIDTHEDNRPMQGLLSKLGFQHCGVIYLEDGAPRLAFQKNT